MSELDGEPGWTDDDAAWSNPVEKNLERLKNSAVSGIVLGVLLGFIAVAVQQSGSAGTGEVSWGAVVTFVIALGSVAFGALAALAHRACGALLAGRTPQD
jgi:hypothetical protein